MLQLEKVRIQRGVRQAELARLVGCSQAAICKFESGEMKPSFDTLIKLAQALECSLDDLVDCGKTETSVS